MTFQDRSEAGRKLAQALAGYRDLDVVVLGLPRGGVPVAFEVANALDAPLDIIVVRKLGLPYQPELAMGAIGEGGVRVLNQDVIRASHLTPVELSAVEATELAELERLARHLRGGQPRQPLAGRAVIIVDDGVATGATARAACLVAKAQGAGPVVLAVPIGSPRTLGDLADEADTVVCLDTPDWFRAVGQGYRDFAQVSDEEVVQLLARRGRQRASAGRHGAETAGAATAGAALGEEIELHAGSTLLMGQLTVADGAVGLVVFAHGSGSGRHSPRNRHVARLLNEAHLATLLFDLLTPSEEPVRALAFDVELLAGRLLEVTASLRERPRCERLPIGYFGASTGAAAALWAAADPRAAVSAVVSRGGRPDLAGSRLTAVHTPTLLIVGGNDEVVLDLNRRAQAMLAGESALAIVPGATHLFEEPGALDHVGRLARDWFLEHLRGAAP